MKTGDVVELVHDDNIHHHANSFEEGTKGVIVSINHSFGGEILYGEWIVQLLGFSTRYWFHEESLRVIG